MKHFIAIVFAFGAACATPGVTNAAVDVADSSISALCGPDAPDGYKRPGGYCDQLDINGSLPSGPSSEDTGCDVITVTMLEQAFDENGRIHVAIPYGPCCYASAGDLPLPAFGAPVEVALLPCLPF